MPIPWPSSLIGEAIVPALVTAIAAGVLGAYLGGSFAAARLAPRALRRAAGAAGGAGARSRSSPPSASTSRDQTPSGWSARVTLDDVDSGAAADRQRDRAPRTRASIGDDAYWLQAIAWQGGGLVVDHLEQVSPGVYRTTEPIPVNGTWKALIRLQRDNYVAGVPIYLPEDSAIPAPAVHAPPSFDRPFVDETQILQRELKSGVPGYLAGIAYSIVAAIVLGLLLLLGWVLNRIARPEDGPGRRDPAPARPPSGAREATA